MVSKKFYFHGEEINFECDVKGTGTERKIELNMKQALNLSMNLYEALYNHIYKTNAAKPTPEPKPEEKKETPPAPTAKTTPKFKYSEQQTTEMKNIKSKLKVKSTDELNPYVHACFMSEFSTWKDLDSVNMDKFITYIKKEVIHD